MTSYKFSLCNSGGKEHSLYESSKDVVKLTLNELFTLTSRSLCKHKLL